MSQVRHLLQSGGLGDLGERLSRALARFVLARQNPDQEDGKKKSGAIRRELDALFWELVQKLSERALERETLEFLPAEKLLINFGLLGEDLLSPLEGAPDGAGLLEFYEEKLARSLALRAHEDEAIFYLTEWITGWQLNTELFASAEVPDETRSTVVEFIDDEKAQKYGLLRLNIYKRLLPVLKTMPGMNLAILRSIISGDFDKNVEIAEVEAKRNPDGLGVPQKRLLAIHKTLIAQLKAAVEDPELQKLVLLLEKISSAMVQRRRGIERAERQQAAGAGPSLQQRVEVIRSEMRLLKNLLPIGGMEGKEPFTSPLITELKHPLSKNLVGDTMKLVRSCDPHIPPDLPVVIVPYKGSGFFEWDKNSLIVPVTPSLPAQEAIIRAAANYRILTDKLEQKGELKRQYERTVEKGFFKERFLHDYTLWVLHVSKGSRKILSSKKFDFFTEFVGPSPKKLLADASCLHLSSYQLRHQTQQILGGAALTQADHHTLAICFWMMGDVKKAKRHMEEAMVSGRPSARLLLSMAYIHRECLDSASAERSFKACIRHFHNTLFGAYAVRELEGQTFI